MNKRLRRIIDYVSGGKVIAFANTMGWSSQYINNLLNHNGFGLTPILSILKKYPEINARWLLLGEGSMITDPTLPVLLMTDELYRITTELNTSLERLRGYFDAVKKE